MSPKPILTRRKVWGGAALALAPAAFGHAATAGYPDRPVKIVHAWSGAPVDAAMRYVADKLRLAWNQPAGHHRPRASRACLGVVPASLPARRTTREAG